MKEAIVAMVQVMGLVGSRPIIDLTDVLVKLVLKFVHVELVLLDLGVRVPSLHYFGDRRIVLLWILGKPGLKGDHLFSADPIGFAHVLLIQRFLLPIDPHIL